MIRPGIDGKWIRRIDGKLTFLGALEECYGVCSRNWKSEGTRAQYDRDYNDRILPFLKDHDGRSIEEYTIEDYEAAIEAIEQRGQERAKVFTPYAESTVQHFRHLMKVVVSAAAKAGLCTDVLWGSRFALPEDTDTEQEHRKRAMLKKSMTPAEEMAVAKELLKNPAQTGEHMGLLLMFALGFRNGEACGADFGDIRPMQLDSSSEVLWVYKSTKPGKSQLQSGGKTRNADRILPMPDRLAEFIQARRKYIAKMLNASEEDTDALPIACVRDKLTERCGAARLTAAGRELFKKIGMREERLAYVEEELVREMRLGREFEKDPTAYLFRRNFGTHLHILGLTEAEIQYVVGHDIEDMYETRNEFGNEEKLLLIRDKLARRPIFNTGHLTNNAMHIPNLPHSGTLSGERYEIPLARGCIHLHLEANESCEPLKARLSTSPGAAPVTVQIYTGTVQPENGRTIDVLKKYHEVYARVNRQT